MGNNSSQGLALLVFFVAFTLLSVGMFYDGNIAPSTATRSYDVTDPAGAKTALPGLRTFGIRQPWTRPRGACR
jgi:hypothetical protein